MPTSSMADHHQVSRQHNDDSGEIDVFEAARYFSSYNDNFVLGGGATHMMRSEERYKGYYYRPGRASLDLPSLKYYHLRHLDNHQDQLPHHHHHQYHYHHHHQDQKAKEVKKSKQPSSPGGKLAHFLNSLFNQAIASKKKKSSKSLSSQSMKDNEDDISPGGGGRRRRRSSIRHLRSISNEVDAKPLYSCSSFGFRSPPPPNTYTLNTPTKSFRSFPDHNREVLATLSKHQTNGKTGNANPKKDDQIRGSKLDCVDGVEKLIKPKINGLLKKTKNAINNGHQEVKKEAVKVKEEVDDGVESDSSSDLFELQIDREFGFCSSGLPVYETTHMENIKRPSLAAVTNNGPILN